MIYSSRHQEGMKRKGSEWKNIFEAYSIMLHIKNDFQEKSDHAIEHVVM